MQCGAGKRRERWSKSTEMKQGKENRKKIFSPTNFWFTYFFIIIFRLCGLAILKNYNFFLLIFFGTFKDIFYFQISPI